MQEDGRDSSTDLQELKASLEREMKRFKQAIDAEGARKSAYFEQFEKAISNEDLTGALIRGHLYVENEMATILRSAVPLYDKIPPRQLMFEAKVAWLRAMALISSEERRALEKLNDTRNKVAHISKPGTVPELKIEQILELREALAPTMLELLESDERKSDDPPTILRSSIVAIVIALYVRGEVASDDVGVADIARYHLTGETVQQRIETARKQSVSDGPELKGAKDVVRKLRYEDRDALRTWIREVYHY
jgi:hypothetical protein